MADTKAIDLNKLKKQVIEYQVERENRYELYAAVIETVLKAACEMHAPLGIVQVRAKSVSSFADKAARKADKYDDPVHQFTDLCGARVIVNTTEEMRSMCNLIRREFVIDETNSNDASARLKEDEFGYQSFHFIVQIGKPHILGTPTRQDVIQDRKAEIQVRTVAQHAWAAVTHDRLYKSSFSVPSRLRRLAHRVAALLEEADEALNHFEGEMQGFLGSYRAYLSPADLAREIEIGEFVLSVDKAAGSALRLARLLRADDRLDQCIAVLRSFQSTTGGFHVSILIELATTLIERWRRTKTMSDRDDGRRLLREAIQTVTMPDSGDPICTSNSERKLVATALAILAVDSEEPYEVAGGLAESLRLDPDDPYILCDQLAYNLEHTNQPAILDSARPAILKAIQTCSTHIRSGLQWPRAWFTMGRLLLLLGRDSESLDGYSKAIHFYLKSGATTWRNDEFEAEIAFLRQVGGHNAEIPPPNRWVRQLLRIGYWLKSKPPQALVEYVSGNISCKEFKAGQRVLIIAGGTQPEVQSKIEQYRNLLRATLDRFEGVVISGGTTAGIPGLVGDVAAALHSQNRKLFTLIGYRPKFVRAASNHYDRLFESGESEALGLAGPFQMWLDLLAGGIDPCSVRLLGVNGGRIARFEYTFALVMGALVGLVESSGRSADAVLCDQDWSIHPKLLPLSNDPMTAQAFSRVGASDLPSEELERMGRIAHDVYRKGKTPDYRKPNTLPWEFLPEWYKKSSCDQAAYAFEMLRGWGFQIKKVGSVLMPISIEDHYIAPMAEQEHGRWNFERLEAGWRRAPKKDDEKKHNPYLVSWAELPLEIRKYDCTAVSSFPEILAAGGYEVSPPIACTG